MYRFIIIYLFAFFLAAPAMAEDLTPADFSDLKRTGSARVETIIDSLTILLTDKRILRLSSLNIPGFATQDHRITGPVLTLLQEILPQGTEVILYQTRKADKGRTNRMGHHLAHIEVKNGNIWVQGLLLSKGLARATPSARNPEMTAQMYDLEDTARQEALGLWAEDAFPLLTPETAVHGLDSYQIIEGTVQKVATVRNNIYLNFGPDWRTDFTIMIKPAVRKQLAKHNIDPMQLAQRTIRVRGWLREYNGPLIELENHTHLEILN